MHTLPEKPLINLSSNFMSYVSELTQALTCSTEMTKTTLSTSGENFAQCVSPSQAEERALESCCCDSNNGVNTTLTWNISRGSMEITTKKKALHRWNNTFVQNSNRKRYYTFFPPYSFSESCYVRSLIFSSFG